MFSECFENELNFIKYLVLSEFHSYLAEAKPVTYEIHYYDIFHEMFCIIFTKSLEEVVFVRRNLVEFQLDFAFIVEFNDVINAE